jgi:hypothetical protein
MTTWAKEARDLRPDPVSGARLTRLTGSSIRTENIYCDAPRATADGKRFAAFRYIDHLLSPIKALVCCDLATKWTCLIDAHVEDVPTSPAWGGSVYYRRGTTLMRASLDTCTTEPVLDMAAMPRCWQLMSVAPDEGRLLYTGQVQESPAAFNLIEIDLRKKSWRALLEKPEENRLGGAYHPVTGAEVLIATALWDGNARYGVGMLADADGRGGRVVYSRVHHAAWLADTGCFAGLLCFDGERMAHFPQNPDGELMIFPADGGPPRLIPAREHIFYHISASRCGRFVVCESLESGFDGPVPIVVVDVVSGKYRTLVADCRCSPAGDDGRQAKPYFMADNKHVIYTADPDGVVNVFAAEVPAGFLESLG